MAEAYICEVVRTAGGRRKGRLSREHPADLGGLVIDAVLDRTGVDPSAVEDVVMGCVSQIGPQTFNIGRTAVLSSNLPVSVPGVAVDRQCGSSQQSVHFAAQAVLSGSQDLVIAGGVESMSQVPILSAMTTATEAGMLSPFAGRKMQERYPGQEFSQFEGAEKVAKKYGVTKDDLDQFAYDSHVRARQATEAGRFSEEIVPVEVELEDGTQTTHDQDEGIRWEPDLEAIRGLEPLAENGLISAANASQITDGASAVLVASEAAVKKYGLKPLARIHTMAVVGSDPTMVLEGPIPGTEQVLDKAGLSIDDMGVYEVNEAFGSVPLAWRKALGADYDKLNVNGGAQALGHPLGATGAKLVGSLVNEMHRRSERYGLLAICEGLGTANATILERVT